jgi:hypothetical protein
MVGMTPDMDDELARLRAENARLVGLLEASGMEWRLPEPVTTPVNAAPLTTDEKVALFRRLFRGRTDVYPVRWESKTTGKSGYSPLCANEWRTGVCEKPRIKCADCGNRLLVPLTDQAIYDHLAGHHTVGVYPLLADDSCHFLAVDFDDADWRSDAQAFALSCRELGVPVVLEISRSGNGAHAWVFFSSNVAARDARRLGTAIISHTCARTRQLKLTSYDRLFPNQDTMPKGGFGNLIALPLQKVPRENGGSVFVDDALRPFPDQWAFLASSSAHGTARYRADDPAGHRRLASTGCHIHHRRGSARAVETRGAGQAAAAGPDAGLADGDLGQSPLLRQGAASASTGEPPDPFGGLPEPEFYKAQAMRLPVWDEPRVIGCAENFPNHIALPRGSLDAAQELLRENGIRSELRDERFAGEPLDVSFAGTLRPDQEAAVAAMLHHDIGVLCAPTAFGKTVTAAALIARRGVNTLVLVHRTELLKQWQERLQAFLGVGKGVIGTIGGGKAKPTCKIDIAVMQSLSRKGEANEIVENYGQVIADECHHLSAFSFEAILKRARAKYVLGLTATPIRRDGRQPIIFMQCGPTRHTALSPAGAPQTLEVIPRYLAGRIDLAADAAIQDVFRHVANDAGRTAAIADEIAGAFERKGTRCWY